MAREDIRAKLDGKGLSVYVDGAEVAARKSFGTADLGGNILPRASYAKIEIPLAAAMGCAGPASISVTSTGLHTLVPCKPIPRKTDSPAPDPSGVPAVALPAPARPPTNTQVAAQSRPAIISSDSPAGISPWPLVGLTIVLTTGGYLAGRRRQHQKSGLIRILEIASLGPKRALVIAVVNGEKMVLGITEAGISLLAPPATAAAPVEARADAVNDSVEEQELRRRMQSGRHD